MPSNAIFKIITACNLWYYVTNNVYEMGKRI